MRKFFVSSNQINENEIEILGDDINHIKKQINDKNFFQASYKLPNQHYFCKHF